MICITIVHVCTVRVLFYQYHEAQKLFIMSQYSKTTSYLCTVITPETQ